MRTILFWFTFLMLSIGILFHFSHFRHSLRKWIISVVVDVLVGLLVWAFFLFLILANANWGLHPDLGYLLIGAFLVSAFPIIVIRLKAKVIWVEPLKEALLWYVNFLLSGLICGVFLWIR